MTEVALYSPRTGELLRLVIGDASDTELADARERTIPAIREEVAEAQRAVDAELLARLDRSRRWTRRVGEFEDGVQWIVRAPSPDAGTTEYDADLLDLILEEMEADGSIDRDAAHAALERTVTITMRVGSREEAEELTVAAARDERTVDARYQRKPKASGIKAICKIPADADRLAPAISTRGQTSRRVTVTRVEKSAC